MSIRLRMFLQGFSGDGGSNTEEVFNQTFTARNFNTSPLTISSLEGDLFDYELIVTWTGTTAGGSLELTFNSDTTANYRQYYMEGRTTIKTASVNDSISSIEFFRFTDISARPIKLLKATITGESGEERYVDSIFSASPQGPRVNKSSCYWKNTADEITSLTLEDSNSQSVDAHIILYRTPKAESQGTWKLVNTLSWSAETAEKSFTSLSGDSDKKYRLVWEGDQELNIELNDDNTANYTRQYLQNSAGSISANNSTSNTSIVTDGKQATVIINAESGVERLCTSSGSNTSAAQQSERAIWWGNTGDAIDSIDCTPAASATGSLKLYKLQSSTATGDTLNFETISGGDESFSSTDFSSGTTHTIAGDSMTLLKIEGVLSNASGDIEIRMQLNSDTASNYPEQLLKADTSTVTAASATRAYIVLAKLQQGDQAEFTHYLYTQSGNERLGLTECSYDENALEKLSQWWTNSGDEITTAKIYASSSDGITGNIRVSELI